MMPSHIHLTAFVIYMPSASEMASYGARGNYGFGNPSKTLDVELDNSCWCVCVCLLMVSDEIEPFTHLKLAANEGK